MESFKILKKYFPLVVLGIFSRIIPHPANFTVIGGLSIWLGSKKNTKFEIFIPVAAMIVSDYWLGFDSIFMRLTVYGSVVLMYLIGRMLSKNLVMASFLASLVFFVTTNLGVWAISTMYTKTTLGLIQCFYMALPFWRNALLADVIFTQVFRYSEMYIRETSANRRTTVIID